VRLLHRVLHRDPDAALNLADVVHVGVDTCLVAGAKTALERPELPDDGIEDARVALAIAEALLRTRPVTEQAFEDDTRVDLCGQRARRRRPGNRVGVRAAVAPVAVAEVAGVFDA